MSQDLTPTLHWNQVNLLPESIKSRKKWKFGVRKPKVLSTDQNQMTTPMRVPLWWPTITMHPQWATFVLFVQYSRTLLIANSTTKVQHSDIWLSRISLISLFSFLFRGKVCFTYTKTGLQVYNKRFLLQFHLLVLTQYHNVKESQQDVQQMITSTSNK